MVDETRRSGYRKIPPAIWTALFPLTILATTSGLLFAGEPYLSDSSIWRPSVDYLLIVFWSLCVLSVVYSIRFPRLLAVVVLTGATIAFGVFFQTLMVVVLLSLFLLLGLALTGVSKQVSVLPILSGIAVLITGIYSIGAIPTGPAFFWALFLLALLLAALIFWRRGFSPPVLGLTKAPQHKWAEASTLSLAVPHFLVSLMPEIGHDALALHLHIPSAVSEFGYWRFAPDSNIFSVGQLFVDWILAVGFVGGGEVVARLINLAGLLVSTRLVFLIAKQLGAKHGGSFVAASIYLTTPVIFLGSASLFVENWWTAFLLGALYKLLRMNKLGYSAQDVLELGLLVGAALAAKFISIPLILAGLLLSLLFFGFPKSMNLKSWLATIPGFFVGVSSYALSYFKTGNPVFPFFNGVFQSPYFPSESFSNSLFPARLSPDIFYLWTFDSGRFLEGSNGSAGFQWLLLVIPAVLGLLIYRRDNTTFFLVSLAFSWVLGVFFQTAYLRYVIPAFAVFSVLVGIAWTTLWQRRKIIRRLASVSVALAIGLNLVHLNAATWYGRIDYKVLLGAQAREEYVAAVLPVRGAIDDVNERNVGNSPVAFFGTSAVAYIKAQAIHTNWYNPSLSAEINDAENPDDIQEALRERGVEYLIINTSSVPEETLELVEKSSELLYDEAGVAVRKLKPDQ